MSKFYLCYKNGASNVCETLPTEDDAFNRMAALGLEDDANLFLFDGDEQETHPLPVGTYETEDYIVAYASTGGMTWTEINNAVSAFAIAATQQNAAVFNIMVSQIE